MIRNSFNYWCDCWNADSSSEGNNELLPQVVRIITTVLVFVAVDWTLHSTSRLPHSYYFEPIIFVQFWGHFIESWGFLFLIPFVGCCVFFLIRCPKNWKDLSNGFYLKVITLVSCGVLTWRFFTLEQNSFFDQPYYFDRILMLAFALLLYFRPMFILPFLLILLPFVNQIEALQGYSWAIASLPIHLLVLTLTVLFIYSFHRNATINEFFFISFCLVAAHYWYPGFGKLRPNWILYDNIPFMLQANYANGWLGFLEPETISSLYSYIKYFNWPMKITALFFEVGSIFAVWRKGLAKVFLFGWIALHIGIFALSGFFFWVWIVIDATLLLLFYLKRNDIDLGEFSVKRAVVGSILIITGAFWTHPTKLAWFDMPATYSYRFEAETEKGRKVWLAPRFFEPFSYQFTLGSFRYTSNSPNLSITLGAGSTSNESVQSLYLKSPKEFLDFEKKFGKVFKNQQSFDQLESFIKEFVENRNDRSGKAFPPALLAPPPYFWIFRGTDEIESGDKIKIVTVYQVTAFYSQGVYDEIRTTKLHEIVIFE